MLGRNDVVQIAVAVLAEQERMRLWRDAGVRQFLRGVRQFHFPGQRIGAAILDAASDVGAFQQFHQRMLEPHDRELADDRIRLVGLRLLDKRAHFGRQFRRLPDWRRFLIRRHVSRRATGRFACGGNWLSHLTVI